MTLNNVHGKIMHLNSILFNDAPVLSEMDGCILFNTDLIYVPTAEAAYVDRTNTAEFVTKVSGDNAGTRVASAQPVRGSVANPDVSRDQSGYVSSPMLSSSTSGKRMMLITVPPTAGPGSVLTVSAPDGSLLSVVVPHTAAPGASITVQY
eukprot:gene4144-4550_t